MAYADDDESLLDAEVDFSFFFVFFTFLSTISDFYLMFYLQEDGSLPDREQVLVSVYFLNYLGLFLHRWPMNMFLILY